MATVVAVVALIADLGREAVEAAVQVSALPGRQAASAVLALQTDQAVELAAQAGGFAAAQLAAADALVDAAVQLGLALVDRLPVVIAGAGDRAREETESGQRMSLSEVVRIVQSGREGRMLGVRPAGATAVVRWEYPGGRVVDITVDARSGRIIGER